MDKCIDKVAAPFQAARLEMIEVILWCMDGVVHVRCEIDCWNVFLKKWFMIRTDTATRNHAHCCKKMRRVIQTRVLEVAIKFVICCLNQPYR